MPYYEPTIVERRELPDAVWLTLLAPELARAVRPGHMLLVRCAPPASSDPLLRRALFCAAADAHAGTVALFVPPDEPGRAWLAAQPIGARIDLYGLVGTPFTLAASTRHLLLVGNGAATPALALLAQHAVRQQCAVVCVALTTTPLPPPYLLPPDVEYHTVASADELADTLRTGTPALLAWADQLCAAGSETELTPLIDAIHAIRLRWERGFAQVALAGPIPCSLATCLACMIETRAGARLRCKDGPVFDLRDLR
jgi:dihydroorotate dehydrogenase electron transfer subunit